MSQDQLFQLEQQNTLLVRQISLLETQVANLTQSDMTLRQRILYMETESLEKQDQIREGQKKILELEKALKFKQSEGIILQSSAQESENNFRNEINISKTYQLQIHNLSQEISTMRLQMLNLENTILSYKHAEEKWNLSKSQMDLRITSQQDEIKQRSNELVGNQKVFLKENTELKIQAQEMQRQISELKEREQQAGNYYKCIQKKYQDLEKLFRNKKFQQKIRINKLMKENQNLTKINQQLDEKQQQNQKEFQSKENSYINQVKKLDNTIESLKNELNTLNLEYTECSLFKQGLQSRVKELEKQND